MEYVILGLLLLRARSGYEIKKALEETISLFYSASFGSINSALRRLLEQGWATVHEQVEQGRNKKLYRITAEGTAAFQTWLGSPIQHEKVKDPALTRLFFLGFLAPAQRIALLEAHLSALEETAGVLTTLEHASQHATVPAEQQELAAFQLLTLQYGRAYYRFSIDWYAGLLKALKEQAHGDAT